jgi:peptidylprolyl isomerase
MIQASVGGRGLPWLAALLWLGLAGSCPAATERDAVAQFGATRFTASELRDFVSGLDPDARQQALNNPRALRQLVQLEIIRKAIYTEALTKNWQEKPDIARQLAATREAIVLKSYLTSVVAMPKSFPSEQEIRATYDLNRDKFMMPRQYHLAQIFISPGKGDFAAAKKKADSLVAQLRVKNGDFATLAKRNSQHKPSADKGGDMGWLADTQIAADMRNRLAGIARGEISDPIRSNQGWHILRVLDTKPAAPRALAEVRPAIVASLRQQRQQSEEQQYIVRLLQKTPVTLNEPQLRKILADAK